MQVKESTVVFHKKGSRAPDTYIQFLGWCKSYWSEDGWHCTKTGNIVPAPKR